MVGSRRRHQLQRQKQRSQVPKEVSIVDHLPPELLAEIHCRIAGSCDRLGFAFVCGASGHLMRPEAPWLILPGETDDKATLFSVAEQSPATVRTPPGPAMRGHVVVGSSGGWLVTADARGELRMANPATAAQADLPAIATNPLFLSSGCGNYLTLDAAAFVRLRFGGPPPPDDKLWGPTPPRTYTMTAAQIRQWFYRKVVLAASSRPGSYAAMLILEGPFAVPAFASSDDAVWRFAPSHDGVEDAIHHDGRFYSITYSGVVEAWDRNGDTGEFTSTVAGPRLVIDGDDGGCGGGQQRQRRKYLAASPDGRLMAIVKGLKEVEDTINGYGSTKLRRVFTVHVLDAARRRWEEAAADIVSDAAVFVGVNRTMCVSTREYRGIRAGFVYYTDDELGQASLRHEQRSPYCYSSYNDRDEDARFLGVYSLRDGTVTRIEGLGKHPGWPPAAWVTPSFL